METKILYDGKFVQLCFRNNWEYIRRKNINGVVAIAAVTDDDEIILIEQFREPLQERIIEPPAGLVEVGETFEIAATRELEEETGYHPQHLEIMGEVTLSPGATNEIVTIVKATGLLKVGEGGGAADENEDITVHKIPLKSVKQWLESKGTLTVSLVHSVLYFLS